MSQISIWTDCQGVNLQLTQLLVFFNVIGVDSIKLDGEDKNQLVVVGEGVDPFNLTCILRKRIGYSDLVRVEEMKKEDGEKKSGETKVELNHPWCSYPLTQPVLVYDEPYDGSSGGCSIL